MVRFSIDDIQEWIEFGLPVEQPDDPFDGLGDFEIAPESQQMMVQREAEQHWRLMATDYERALRMIQVHLRGPGGKKKPTAKEMQARIEHALFEIMRVQVWV